MWVTVSGDELLESDAFMELRVGVQDCLLMRHRPEACWLGGGELCLHTNLKPNQTNGEKSWVGAWREGDPS